jgi:hypothetical protein
MKKFLLFSLVLALTLTLGFGVAFAGNGAPSGPHYNLNIIGVENPKNADMTGSSRHTIFVALGKNDSVKTAIYLTEGDFQVCDGNGFDPAYDCDGNVIGRKDGAVFQLPANGCWLEDCGEGYDPDSQVYEVYVRALGTPGGSGTITTCVETYDEFGDPVDVCSTENVVLVRNAGPSKFVNKTKELTTIVLEVDIYKWDKDTSTWVVVGTKDVRYGLFEDDFGQYFWDYDNNGLRLVQLRFYDL